MKIVFLTFTPLEYAGGFEKYLMRTARDLSLYPEIEINIVAFDNTRFTNIIRKLLQLYYLKKISKELNSKESGLDIQLELGPVAYVKVSSIRDLRAELIKYNLIYVKNELLDAFILKFILKYKKIPPVIFCCGTPIVYPDKSIRSMLRNYLYGGFIYKFLTTGVAAFHVKNATDENKLTRMGARTHFTFNPLDTKSMAHQPTKVLKIHIPLDLGGLLERSEEYENISAKAGRFTILWTGRLTFQKGIDDLVEIIGKINDSELQDRIRWIILGDGEEKGKIVSLAAKWSNVFYYGHVKHEYIPTFLKTSQLFISTSKWESFGQNILEAQVMDIPVISYNIPGPNEIVDNNVTGFLVNKQTEFIQRIREVVNQKHDFKNIHAAMERKFSPEVIHPRLIHFFKEVIHGS